MNINEGVEVFFESKLTINLNEKEIVKLVEKTIRSCCTLECADEEELINPQSVPSLIPFADNIKMICAENDLD